MSGEGGGGGGRGGVRGGGGGGGVGVGGVIDVIALDNVLVNIKRWIK